MQVWELVKDGEIIQIDPDGPLITQPGSAAEMLVQAAAGGLGILCLFEDWLQSDIDCGALAPFLYYSGCSYLPAPLRAFVDFVRRNTE